MLRKPARRCGLNVLQDPAPEAPATTKSCKSDCRGRTLLELMAVVAFISVVSAMALPLYQNTVMGFRLSAAAAAVAGAIQQTRYQAIMNGCYYTIAFTTASTTYQVQTQTISGTPPSCATNADTSPNFTNVGGAIPWTTGAGLSVLTSTTLEFGSSGIVGPPPSPATSPLVPCAPTCSFQLSSGNATRTVTVSGVGNVKVTTP